MLAGGTITELIQSREITGKRKRSDDFDLCRDIKRPFKQVPDEIFSRIPQSFKERQFNTKNVAKIFASAWLDGSNIITGSKDNKLHLWSIKQKNIERKDVPLPKISGSPYPEESRGIHSVCVNGSRSLMATGSDNPNEVAVYQVSYDRPKVTSEPELKPISVLKGHSDWAFSISFTAEDRVISGSRDGSLCLWTTDPLGTVGPIQPRSPLTRRKEHERRIRSLCYSRQLSEIFTLGGEGMLKSWDSSRFEVTITYELPDKEDPVCIDMSSQHPLLAIGSLYYISLIDPRQPEEANTIPSLDSDWGVRSVSFNNNLLTIGGGKGRLSFVDIRKMQFLPVGLGEDGFDKFYYQTGNGWLPNTQNPNVLVAAGLTPDTIPHAAHSHCYDPSGTRLFVGGGPLLTGLDGSYAALW